MKITKKSITLLLAGLLCASNSFSQTYPKQDGVIRLLTYNTHYCKGGTDPGSLNDLNTKRFANILKALDADVVALQELDSAANGRWKRVLLDDIAKWSELDYVQVYGIAADYDGGSVGNGTLVKRWLPIKKIKKMKLSSDVGRILIRTDFEDFSFMSTHLDLDDKHRMNEAAAICTELDYIRKPVSVSYTHLGRRHERFPQMEKPSIQRFLGRLPDFQRHRRQHDTGTGRKYSLHRLHSFPRLQKFGHSKYRITHCQNNHHRWANSRP